MNLCRHAAAAALAASLWGAATANAQSDWEFNITPYAWFSGLDGDLGAVPGFPAQEVSLSFGDILDDLDYGLFLFASARNGPWVMFFDGSAVQVTSTEGVGGPAVDNVEVESFTANVALAAGRSITRSDRYNVDAYAGARAWWLDNTFKVRTQPATGRGTVSRSSGANWIDPMVGLAVQYTATDKWFLYGNADIGGFGVGADLEYSVTAGATYSVNDWFGVTLAWRYLYIDYSDDGIVYDVSQNGPLLGATFRF